MIFKLLLLKGEDTHEEMVSIQSKDGIVPTKTFVDSLPKKYKDYDIIDITKQ